MNGKSKNMLSKIWYYIFTSCFWFSHLPLKFRFIAYFLYYFILHLSHFANPLDVCDQLFVLDMIFLDTPQLCAGVDIHFFSKCPFWNTLMNTPKIFTLTCGYVSMYLLPCYWGQAMLLCKGFALHRILKWIISRSVANWQWFLNCQDFSRFIC